MRECDYTYRFRATQTGTTQKGGELYEDAFTVKAHFNEQNEKETLYVG